MCGIVGIRRFDGQPVHEELLRAMAARLAHRGPDGEGYWVDGSVGFGHRRLSIIDVAGSPQPMATADERVHVTFNGEIFNFRELRDGLDYPFRTGGDTEVLLALLPARRAPGRSSGCAASSPTRCTTATTCGWSATGSASCRCSPTPTTTCSRSRPRSRRCCRRCRPPRRSTWRASTPTSRGGPSAAPHTLFEGVTQAAARPPPARRRRRALRARAVLAVPDRRRPGRVADDEAVELVPTGSRTRSRARWSPTCPVGSLLSGGVDSSLIVALATKLREGEPVETFSAGFGDPRYDELPHAREVSRAFGTNHHEVVVEPGDFVDLWPRLTWHRDAPISEPADVAVFRLAKLARQSVKVLLSGEGSDELFAGYPKYRLARLSNLADAVPAGLAGAVLGDGRAAAAGVGRVGPASRCGPWPRPPRPTGWLVVRAVHRARAADAAGGLASSARPTADPSAGSTPSSACWSRLPGWLADNLLERGDRMSMAASVELRPPFLDHRLVELAFSLPSWVKVRPGQTKWVLKEVARRHLPERSSTGARSGSACRSTPGSAAASGTWPGTCSSARPRSWARRSTRPRCGRCSTPTSRAGATSRSGSGRCCRSRSGTTCTSATATGPPRPSPPRAPVAERPLVTIVVVTYNSSEDIAACLDSALGELPDDGSEVVVLDNASSDGTADVVEERWPQVHLVRSPDNLGFARACNQAAAAGSSRFVLLLNPDAVMLPGCLAALVDVARRHPDGGLYGGRVYTEDGDRRSDVVLGSADVVEHVLLRHRPLDRVRVERRGSTPKGSGRGPATSSVRSTSSPVACCSRTVTCGSDWAASTSASSCTARTSTSGSERPPPAIGP